MLLAPKSLDSMRFSSAFRSVFAMSSLPQKKDPFEHLDSICLPSAGLSWKVDAIWAITLLGQLIALDILLRPKW